MVALDVIEQVALIVGKVLHEGTGQPIVGQVQITVSGYLVIVKILSDGTFVTSGRPELLFPELAAKDYQLHLKIQARSLQFRQELIEQSLTVTIPKGWTFEQPITTPLPTSTSPILVLFPAEPVFVRGYVFDAEFPGVGIASATVTIEQGAKTYTATTSADPTFKGRYSFQDVIDPSKPQAFIITASNPASIHCSAPNFKPSKKRAILIDFERSLHEEFFRLIHV